MVKLGALHGECMRREQQGQDEGCENSPEHDCRPLACPRPLEGGRVVTLLALRSEAPGMYVVSRMTRAADHRRLDDVLRPYVTVGATHLPMRAHQREAGVGGMIEVPHLPTVRRVAHGAVLAQSAIVDIVLRVTSQAIFGCVVEFLRGVALPAGDDNMQSGQRILRLIVIEGHVLPFGRVVALLAFLAQRSAVGLVGTVAVDTLGAKLLILRDARVAYMAIELRVRANECELEFDQVIEVGDLPGVIAMTIGTSGSQPACVLVVRLMAPGAIFRYRVLQVPAAMAVTTADARMPAEQGKPCLARVIELLGSPVGG